jgi:Arm DNA-binding domain
MTKLTARKVETAKPGKHGDGGGLQLVVSATGARKWVFRFMQAGRAREMGLGAYPTVGLALAREKALEAQKLAKARKDPIAEGRRTSGVPTFGELADEVVAEQSKGFRNEKHKAQWAMTLTINAEPLRAKPVDKIETADVLAVLKPIWLEKPETASRVRGRIERVLNAAKAKGYGRAKIPPHGAAIWRTCCRSSPSSRAGTTRPCRMPTFPPSSPNSGSVRLRCPGARVRDPDGSSLGRGAECSVG